MNRKPQSRKENIVIQELEKELLIYDLKINKAFSLNETCAMVWAECDGEKSTAEIASKLSIKTNGLVNEEVVWLALETLQKENLLTNKDVVQANFNGLSRRQVIRKVGFATMVAIPIITSLIAPTAAEAASGVCAPGLLAPGSTYVGLTSGFICSFCTGQCRDSGPFFCCSRLANNPSGTCFSNGGFGLACNCECT